MTLLGIYHQKIFNALDYNMDEVKLVEALKENDKLVDEIHDLKVENKELLEEINKLKDQVIDKNNALQEIERIANQNS